MYSDYNILPIIALRMKWFIQIATVTASFSLKMIYTPRLILKDVTKLNE